MTRCPRPVNLPIAQSARSIGVDRAVGLPCGLDVTFIPLARRAVGTKATNAVNRSPALLFLADQIISLSLTRG